MTIPAALQELIDAYAPTVRHYRTPGTAATRCYEASTDFAAYLTERGVRSEPWPAWADELGFRDRVATPWLQDDSHCVTAVYCAGRTFTVDWTASQYGRPEFPLVREVDELPRRNPWLLSPDEAAEHMAQLHAAVARGGKLW